MKSHHLYRGLFALSVASLVTVPALHAGARPTKSEVARREENQQDRIANGIKTGELTPAEVARLEKREARLREQIKDDRAADGGKLTPAERVQINRELDRLSTAIYRAKHNGQTVPPATP
jgi:hypothetical protein